MEDEEKIPQAMAQANVTAAELVRGFAKWRDAAQQSPVFISTHGRVTHVLANADSYRRLAQSEVDVVGDPGSSLYGLADYIREGVVLLDNEERISYVNPYAKAFFDLHGIAPQTPFLEAVPSAAGTLFVTQYRRTMASREPLSADLPSNMHPGRWVNFQTIALHGNVVLLFRDITEEVEAHRLADVKLATINAISQHPDVGYVRISPRGTIERTDDAFCEWMGMTDDRLRGVRLLDLMARRERADAKAAIEGVLSGDAAQRFRASMTPNHDEPFNIDCSAVPLHGAYGLEGAVIVCTRIRG